MERKKPTNFSEQFVCPGTIIVQGTDYFGMLSPKRKSKGRKIDLLCHAQ